MLQLLSVPFHIVGGVIRAGLGIAWGVIRIVFGLLGGMVSLVWNLLAVGLIVGLIVAVFSRKTTSRTSAADTEEFTSFYRHR